MKTTDVLVALLWSSAPFCSEVSASGLRNLTNPPIFSSTDPTTKSKSHVTSVEVEESCYTRNEELVVGYQNGEPLEDDWVGIYPSDYHATEEPVFWLYTCGSSKEPCENASAKGSISIVLDDANNYLEPGQKYKAVMGREVVDENDETYDIIGESDTFIITRGPSCALTGHNNHNNSTTPRQLQGGGGGMATVIARARQRILDIYRREVSMPARVLRLIFHDCIGGRCDGCVNMRNPEHAGLQVAMGALRNVALEFRGNGLTRADVWALASFVAVEFTMPSNNRIDFPFQYYGREDCPGQDMMAGPDPLMCGPNMGTSGMIAFLQSEFDFSLNQVAAIMGAHTIGVLRRDIFGFDGPNGWVVDNTRFDNQYFQELIGANGNPNLAPNWRQTRVPGTGRWQWVGFPAGRQVTMLNVDVAMVRNIGAQNRDQDGRVTCEFLGRTGPRCQDSNPGLFRSMMDYASNNRVFLRDFHKAMVQMVNVGYRIDNASCDRNNICRLVR